MQLTVHALLVTTIALVLCVGRALVEPREATEPPATIAAPAQPKPPAAPTQATVVKPFGASIRVAPALDAAGLYNVACGTVLPVLSVEGGWVKVQTAVGAGWVGSGRLALSDGPATADCVGKRFLAATSDAWTVVAGNCLSVRQRPSPEASALACVGNGHLFRVVDGPFDPGSGDDWFKVTSPTTGTGWALADHLYPL